MNEHKFGASDPLSFEPSAEGLEAEVKKHTASDDLGEFNHNLAVALRDKDLVAARKIVADAETVLMSQECKTSSSEPTTALSKPHLAAAKTRIAMRANDPLAARAILVQAIERWPDALFLRTLMTEIMLASGRAKDVRSMLTHLGQPTDTSPEDQAIE